MEVIAGLLLKLFSGPILTYLNKRSDNAVLTNGQNVSADVTVTQAQLQAYIEERKVIAQERAAQRGSLWTAWMIPVAFGLCMLHFGAIVLDSTFPLHWGIPKIPPPYDQMEWSIVMAVIGLNGISATVRKVFSK